MSRETWRLAREPEALNAVIRNLNVKIQGYPDAPLRAAGIQCCHGGRSATHSRSVRNEPVPIGC